MGQSLFAKHEIFLSTVFWNKLFAWSRHFKELQLKCNLFDCPCIWTVASLTYRNNKGVCKLFISKYLFSKSDFCTISLHIFLNSNSQMFCKFALQLNLAKCRHFFWSWNWGKNKLAKNKTLTGSFQKVVTVLASSGCQKFLSLFHFRILGKYCMCSLIALHALIWYRSLAIYSSN